MTYYANDLKDFLPRPVSGDLFLMSTGGIYASSWPQVLISQGYFGTWSLAIGSGGSSSYDLAFAPMMHTLFDCPGTPYYGKTHFDRSGDYAMNGTPGLNWNATKTSAQYEYHERRANILRPSDLILLGDGRLSASSGSNLDMPSAGNFLHNPTRIRTQHMGGGNYAWHDGHVKLLKYTQDAPALSNKLPWYNVRDY